VARGWESKAVESQQQDRSLGGRRPEPPSKEARERAQRRTACELSRARVLSELSACRSDVRRHALESALAHLEAELASLTDTP
jgi:hypothetical protein